MGLLKVLRRKMKFMIAAALVCYGLFVVYTAGNSFLQDAEPNRKVSGEEVEGKVRTMERSIENHLRDGIEDVQDTRLERIDWNNYSLMERDSTRTGLGEQGAGVKLDLNSEETVQRQKLKDKYRYDAYVADLVSLERSIGDLRPEACKNVTYIKDIPENSVSVIIPMFNEKNSTLLRSIHSIINRSPASLLKEVIVVDDFSQEEELKAPLDDYVREHFSNVKIVRNKQREGLIRSRIIGADASTGSFLVFLDSHVEVNYNYLPPLLELVVLDYRTIACPTVDFVEASFKIQTLIEKRTRGGFSWKLNYHRMPMNVLMDDTTPHNNPIMVGCAFAISRKWWEELGKYDPGLYIWGAEQFELSVKSWLCGGRVVDLPCSRVAHLFRDWPYAADMLNTVDRNVARFAAVWMDGYREVVFQRKPELRNIDLGDDIIKQIELRKRLQCKPFDWFLTEVAPDILEHFPIVEPPPLATGHLILRSNSSLCASNNGKNTYLVNCNTNGTSVFTYDWRQRILQTSQCFNSVLPNHLIIGRCHDVLATKFQSFSWDPTSGQIISYFSRLCLDSKPENLQLFLADCDVNKSSQSWKFEYFDSSRVNDEWNKFTKPLL